MRQERIDANSLELNEKVVSIKRVTKVVKGGRNMRFTALVVVGDGNGHVGAGLGKATEIPEAIRKGKEDAAKNLISVALDENDSVTHDYIGKFGGASVLLKKAPEGTGVIAGGPARAVIEMAGIKNIRTKSLGSNNKQNVVLATIEDDCCSAGLYNIMKLPVRNCKRSSGQHDTFGSGRDNTHTVFHSLIQLVA